LKAHDIIHLRLKVLGLRNTDIFFSTGVVLVEGDSDAVAIRGVLSILQNGKGGSSSLLGVSVIDCGGAKSIVPLARVLRELDIPYLLIFDRDYLQDTAVNGSPERSFNAKEAATFSDLESLFKTGTQFAVLKSRIVSRFSSGYATSYPLAINRELLQHRILMMRTEHETDFIDEHTATHVANIVGHHIPDGECPKVTADYLKRNHRKQIKQATNTARVLSLLTNKADLPSCYRRLCQVIIRVFGS
jgi:putative ATP-dependent endonuclease of the OLD family